MAHSRLRLIPVHGLHKSTGTPLHGTNPVHFPWSTPVHQPSTRSTLIHGKPCNLDPLQSRVQSTVHSKFMGHFSQQSTPVYGPL